MSKKRIAIAGFQHETNTFCPFPATLDDFEKADSWPALTKGEAVIDTFKPLNIPLGGFITASDDWELIPILWASAEPSGKVESKAFDAIVGQICQAIVDAGDIDGIFLDLHGAMVTDDYEDGEAEIVSRVRQVVGNELPLVCSLDFHANISPAFVEDVSAFTIYRHYPHIDMAYAGERAAAMMSVLMKTNRPLFKCFRQLDYLVPLSSQGTTRYPFDQLYASIEQFESEGVLSVDAAAGFTAADIYHCGPSVIAFGYDEAAANLAADELHKRFVEAEAEIVDELLSPEQAISTASELIKSNPQPVVLADVQDNPGAGGTCDTTAILQAAIASDSVAALFGVINDPQSVVKCWQAGEGAKLDLSLGNAYPIDGTEAFNQSYTVEHLSDALIHCTGSMYGGCEADLGAMAVLRVNGTEHDIYVVLSSQRFQCLDLAVFRQMGLSEAQPQIIVVKSTIHFLADFEPIAQRVLFVEAPGSFPCRLDRVDYINLRSGARLGPLGRAQR